MTLASVVRNAEFYTGRNFWSKLFSHLLEIAHLAFEKAGFEPTQTVSSAPILKI